jgi:tRNA-splicing ligase RtcB
MSYLIEGDHAPIKAWTDPTFIEPSALQQLKNTASLPCIYKHVAVMPDVHYGIGATVGSVVATKKAIIPAAVGVDIGCGMMAVQLPVCSHVLPDNLRDLRGAIEALVPVGFNEHGVPLDSALGWGRWEQFFHLPKALQDVMGKAQRQLGTLGGGNHFIEICIDTRDNVWILLHSGSRHIGNRIGQYFIEEAKGLFAEHLKDLADPDLAYLTEGTKEFQAYWRALVWAQNYAEANRILMMQAVVQAFVTEIVGDPSAQLKAVSNVNCHHNYAAKERHFGEDIYVTRKGAVRAGVGDYGIIPGSMGTRSYIVRGKGNADSFTSCSHGAGRRMSRGAAKRLYGVEDVEAQTQGVECRKDEGVIDEIPAAYKSIDEVMEYQKDLVEVIAELKQVVCVKG